MKVLVLVDGEHYPPVVRAAIEEMTDDVVGALFCGGTEKVDVDDLEDAYGVPVVRGDDLATALREAIERFRPEIVLDCTDEPVLTPADRFRLASVALLFDVTYRGADFELRPPVYADIVSKASVTIFATGKRTGKTAVSSAFARHAVSRDRRPVIVAVGRGGPDPPEVIEANSRLDAEALLKLVSAGKHASSDYVEDALTSGVTTIGCVRVGGGLAGATISTNMDVAARMAQERDEDLVILEGSGASIPEVRSSAGIVIVPATIDPAVVGSYLNPYRLLLADLAVVTMAEEAPMAARTAAAIHGSVPELEVLNVVVRPEPLADVSGREVFFCTTAPESSGAVLKDHLEQTHGCMVVGVSHHLADRKVLRTELADAPQHDTLLVEVKAAAVDVAARTAQERGTEVVFVNNGLVGTGVEEAFDRVLSLASERLPS